MSPSRTENLGSPVEHLHSAAQRGSYRGSGFELRHRRAADHQRARGQGQRRHVPADGCGGSSEIAARLASAGAGAD